MGILLSLRKIYWYIFRPKTFGVKVLAKNNNKILLVRNSYGHKDVWTLPGGGIKKGETPEEAAMREFKEEVGVGLQYVKKIGEYISTREYKKDTVYCFSGDVDSESVKIDPREIDEAKWFKQDEIPSNHSYALDHFQKLLQ